MLTLDRITQRRNDDQVDSDVVERDYVLTQVMASRALHPDNGVFQFKGGTSIRLCYFPEYRYSAVIDDRNDFVKVVTGRQTSLASTVPPDVTGQAVKKYSFVRGDGVVW